jgi:hypothetical protein
MGIIRSSKKSSRKLGYCYRGIIKKVLGGCGKSSLRCGKDGLEKSIK